MQEGEKLYRMVGNLPDKDMAMLEERIKRASKTRAEVTSQPAPAPVEAARPTARPATGPRPPSAVSAGAARDTESEVSLLHEVVWVTCSHTKHLIARPSPA